MKHIGNEPRKDVSLSPAHYKISREVEKGSGRALAYYLRNVWGKVLAHPEIQLSGEPYQEGQCPNLEWRNFWNLATLPCHLHARSQPALCCLWLVLYPLDEIPRVGANLWRSRLRVYT